MIRAAYAFQSQGLGQADPGRPRGAGAREHARSPASTRPRPSWRSSTPGVSHRNADYVDYLYERLQRAGLPAPRRAAADQPGPQLLRRRHGGAGPRRRHGHRRHPHLRPGAGRGAAGDRPGARRPGDRHVGRAGQGPHPVHRRHQRHRDARRPRTWWRSPCEAARAVRALGYSRAWPSCPTRPSAIPMGERSEKVREAVAMLDAHGRRRLRVRGRDAAGAGAGARDRAATTRSCA